MIAESIPFDARPTLSARARLETDKITGKPILLYPEGVLTLNPTGHAIVSLCTGRSTFEDMLLSLASLYKTSPQKIAPEIEEYLNRLRHRNLLELRPA